LIALGVRPEIGWNAMTHEADEVEGLRRRIAELERRESLQRATLEANPDLVLRFGLDTICTYASPSISSILGYTQEEHVGRSGFAIIHPDDQDMPRELRERLLAVEPGSTNDRFGPFLSRLRHKDGHYIWVESMVAILRAPGTGEVEEFALTARDAHARVEAEAALRASEARFRSLLESLDIGVLVQGEHSEILLHNQAALDMLGLTAGQLLGRDSFDPRWVVCREDGSPLPGDEQPVPRALATGQPVRNVTMSVERPATQDRVWLQVSATPQRDERGRVHQAVCTFTDITERKRAEALIREQKRLLEQLSSPIIPIAPGVVVLPLIGSFDASRLAGTCEVLLTGVATLCARVVILDVTGVSAADEVFTDGLLRLARAVGLLGARLVITGISPALARSLVAAQIDLGTLVVRGTLQDGVAFAFTQ
jgi:PAS domain S-box-containing protein